MMAWAAVVLAGIGTFVFRFGVAAVVDRLTLPAWFERASANVMPACFAGLAAVALLGHANRGLGEAVPLAVGAVVTVVVARSRPAHVAMFCGLGVLWAAEVESELGVLHCNWVQDQSSTGRMVPVSSPLKMSSRSSAVNVGAFGDTSRSASTRSTGGMAPVAVLPMSY